MKTDGDMEMYKFMDRLPFSFRLLNVDGAAVWSESNILITIIINGENEPNEKLNELNQRQNGNRPYGNYFLVLLLLLLLLSAKVMITDCMFRYLVCYLMEQRPKNQESNNVQYEIV